ncbi:MAG: hypothetical protein RIS75_1039 [Actinomycetota bacterium]
MTKSPQLPNRANHLRLVTSAAVEVVDEVQVASTPEVVGEPSISKVHQLLVVDELADAESVDLDPEAQYELAKKFVLRRLTGSGQTRFQLEQYLQTKEFPRTIIDQVLDRFEELGLLNDQEFAETWVRNRRSTKKSGPAVLRRELQERGVSSQAIAAAVESREGEDYDLARDIALKKLPGLMRYEPQVRIRRLANFLVRRGYNPGLAFTVVKELFAEAETVLEDPDYSGNY